MRTSCARNCCPGCASSWWTVSSPCARPTCPEPAPPRGSGTPDRPRAMTTRRRRRTVPGMAEDVPAWDFAVAPPRTAPGVSSMVGYRALDVPHTLHRGLPSSRLTFIVAMDDGVEAAATMDALPAVHPAPIILGGLHTSASYVRQRPAQAGVQIAMHPLAARAVFGIPAAELPVTEFDGTSYLGTAARDPRSEEPR